MAAGETTDLVLTWFRSHVPAPGRLDVDETLEETRRWWQDWADRIEHDGAHRDEVVRSLVLLRALTNHQTGGIAAAATTSLPEDFGGERNWDYRYVWLRDVALTLEAMIDHGFTGLVEHWREWLLRAVAGDPADLQIMYGLAGERDLFERELDSLPGYEGSRPVRVGNGASGQYQADVVGGGHGDPVGRPRRGAARIRFLLGVGEAADPLCHRPDRPSGSGHVGDP